MVVGLKEAVTCFALGVCVSTSQFFYTALCRRTVELAGRYVQIEKRVEEMRIMGEVKERWCPYFDHDLFLLFAFDSRRRRIKEVLIT